MSSNIVVPQLGESVVEARVARWLKKVGDPVAAGEPLVELETDKIDLEVGADQAGVLTRIDRQAGEDVKVGELLAVVDASGNGASRAAAATPRSIGPDADSGRRYLSLRRLRQPPRRPPTMCGRRQRRDASQTSTASISAPSPVPAKVDESPRRTSSDT